MAPCDACLLVCLLSIETTVVSGEIIVICFNPQTDSPTSTSTAAEMKKFSCSQYFPTQLALSEHERAAFLRLEQTLVHETLDEYAEYRTVPYDARSSAPMSTSVLDLLEWKAVHRHGDLTVFKDRKKTANINGGEKRVRCQRLRRPDGGYDTVEARYSIPTLLTYGHLRGRLNDTMYGAIADTDSSFRLRSSYLADDLDDSKILHKLEGPTLEDPFRFCGIVWFVYGHAFGPIMRRRDSVLLVATGTTTSKQGDRIGYTIYHSVKIPQLQPLTELKFERAFGSLVFVKRQLDDQRVELFQKGFFAPMGDVPEFAMVHALIRGMLRAGNSTIEASLSKKLFWMMQDAARLRKQRCVGECVWLRIGD